MADPAIKPTPTQEENDRTAMGEHVIDHENDGSTFQPGDGPPAPRPNVTFTSPSSGLLPSVAVSVNGQNFTLDSVVVFDGAVLDTAFVSSTVIRTTLTKDAAGDYPLHVRDPAGDSNSVTFTFTVARAAGGDEPSDDSQARGRRRR